MADFQRALPFVLTHEGGWVNDPADPGGATNLGITLNVFLGYGRDADVDPASKLEMDLDHDGDVDVDDLKRLTPEMAGVIYRKNYWRFDGVKDQACATKIFDLCVNMGVKAGIKLAQLAAGVANDGQFGPETEAALNAAQPHQLLTALCRAAAARYRAIVAARPASRKFLVGWLRRAAEVPHVV
jgi:lysozyme family protein